METKEIYQKLHQFVNEVSLGYKGTIDLNLLREAADRLKAMDVQIYQHMEEIADLKKQLAENQPEWISVEERLPEKGGYYLTVVENCERVCYSRLVLDKFGHDGVTHWMPLPEPPKPKEPAFKDVFLKKFPKAPIDEDGIPKACIADVFPWAKHEHCDGWMCFEDWNQPYFEEEGKVDA